MLKRKLNKLFLITVLIMSTLTTSISVSAHYNNDTTVIETEEIVNFEEVNILAESEISPFMNFEYIQTFYRNGSIANYTINGIAIFLSNAAGGNFLVSSFIDLATYIYNSNVNTVYTTEYVYRSFDYRGPIPIIMAEQVIIYAYSDSARTNLIGVETVYYYP
ncbi:hypothetical protein HYQ40_02675 [Aerococcaceae bacterium DSM 111021]|nr:hypothetical protein [Aerococcaceae bacterium DSM 111021]